MNDELTFRVVGSFILRKNSYDLAPKLTPLKDVREEKLFVATLRSRFLRTHSSLYSKILQVKSLFSFPRPLKPSIPRYQTPQLFVSKCVVSLILAGFGGALGINYHFQHQKQKGSNNCVIL